MFELTNNYESHADWRTPEDQDSKPEFDFDELRKEKDRLKKGLPFNSAPIRWYWGELERDVEKANLILEKIIGRIKNETNFLKNLEELEILPVLLELSKTKKIAGARIKWEGVTNDDTGIAATHRPVANLITLHNIKPPSASEIIKSLAFGALPESLEILIHELIHKKQYPESILLTIIQVLKTLPKLEFEIQEAQAYRGESHNSQQQTSRTTLIDFILNAKDSEGKIVYKNFSKDKLIFGIHAVEYLEALNFSAGEIGKIILNSRKWDTKKGCYPDIEKIIAEKTRKIFGLGQTQDYIPDLENLTHANKLKREIDSLKVKIITREVLEKEINNN